MRHPLHRARPRQTGTLPSHRHMRTAADRTPNRRGRADLRDMTCATASATHHRTHRTHRRHMTEALTLVAPQRIRPHGVDAVGPKELHRGRYLLLAEVHHPGTIAQPTYIAHPLRTELPQQPLPVHTGRHLNDLADPTRSLAGEGNLHLHRAQLRHRQVLVPR